VIGKPIEYVGS